MSSGSLGSRCTTPSSHGPVLPRITVTKPDSGACSSSADSPLDLCYVSENIKRGNATDRTLQQDAPTEALPSGAPSSEGGAPTVVAKGLRAEEFRTLFHSISLNPKCGLDPVRSG